MGTDRSSTNSRDLAGSIVSSRAPVVIDVRRVKALRESDVAIPTSIWREPLAVAEWRGELDPGDDIVVYCVHGHNVSQGVAGVLRNDGFSARALEGGIEAYREFGGPLLRRDALPPRGADGRSCWVTREWPKIDRIACPWFVRRFLDRDAAILYVEAEQVEAVARDTGAVPFDIKGAELGHSGERCSFDAFLARYMMPDRALDLLAAIIRGADTDRPDLADESAGLLAISRGLSEIHDDDLEMLDAGMTVYDALYADCRRRVSEAGIGAGRRRA